MLVAHALSRTNGEGRAAVEGHHQIADRYGERATIHVVVNRRARRISLRVDPSLREAIVTSPTKRAAPEALAFAQERVDWIVSQLARLPPPVAIADGAVIPVLGAPRRLTFEQGRGRPRMADDPSTPALIVPAPDEASFPGRVVRFLKAEAKQALERSVDRYAALLNVRPTSLTVKDTRSRWGSCTSDGALAFSWRVVLAPPPVLHYLAAHEVAHLREMNHSPRFWALVGQCKPDYREARAWLRRHGPELHAVGRTPSAV